LLSTTATGTTTSIMMTTTAAVTTKTIMMMTAGRGAAEAVLKTEPAVAAKARGGRGGGSGKGEGRQQSTKSIENDNGGNSGGQEVPGKRREAAGVAGAAAGAVVAAAAAVAVAVVAMAVGERPEAREESNVIGVPRILLGNNLAQNRAMHLENAYPEGPNDWCLHRLLSVPQIDLSAHADRKMVILYVYLHYFTKKSQLYRTDMQIKKIIVQTKNLRTPSYVYLRSCIFSKEITASGPPAESMILSVPPAEATHKHSGTVC
jgi:hypothetical protein